jgi:hypothetical protein
MRISRLGGTSRLTTLLALRRFLPFQADDRNRNQRGGGVDPAEMKHRIEDQAGKGYAGKVDTGIRSDYRRTSDLDDALLNIRNGLSKQTGQADLDFYDDDI